MPVLPPPPTPPPTELPDADPSVKFPLLPPGRPPPTPMTLAAATSPTRASCRVMAAAAAAAAVAAGAVDDSDPKKELLLLLLPATGIGDPNVVAAVSAVCCPLGV